MFNQNEKITLTQYLEATLFDRKKFFISFIYMGYVIGLFLTIYTYLISKHSFKSTLIVYASVMTLLILINLTVLYFISKKMISNRDKAIKNFIEQWNEQTPYIIGKIKKNHALDFLIPRKIRTFVATNGQKYKISYCIETNPDQLYRLYETQRKGPYDFAFIVLPDHIFGLNKRP